MIRCNNNGVNRKSNEEGISFQEARALISKSFKNCPNLKKLYLENIAFSLFYNRVSDLETMDICVERAEKVLNQLFSE